MQKRQQHNDDDDHDPNTCDGIIYELGLKLELLSSERNSCQNYDYSFKRKHLKSQNGIAFSASFLSKDRASTANGM